MKRHTFKAIIAVACFAFAAFAQESEPPVDAPSSATAQSVMTTETDTEWTLSFRYGPTYTAAGKTVNDYRGAVVTKTTITRRLMDGREIGRDVSRETRNVSAPLKLWFTNAATNTVVIVSGPGKVNRHADAPSRLFNNSTAQASE